MAVGRVELEIPEMQALVERLSGVERGEVLWRARRAREIAPEVKTPFRAATAESLLVILEGGDPLASVALTEGELAGREPRQVILGFARGALEASDPAAGALRARLRELGKDPRGKHLWGRKAAALLVAASDLAKG